MNENLCLVCPVKEGLHKVANEVFIACTATFEATPPTNGVQKGGTGGISLSARQLQVLLKACPYCFSVIEGSAATAAAKPGKTASAVTCIIPKAELAQMKDYCAANRINLQQTQMPFGGKIDEIHEGVRTAFLRAITVGLNQAGWIDLGSMYESGDSRRLLIKHVRPQSTMTGRDLGAFTPDDDHPSVLFQLIVRETEISACFTPNVSRMTAVSLAELCPGKMRERMEQGQVIDLTGMHDDHAINQAARCVLLRGLEPALILAVSKDSSHDFLNHTLEDFEGDVRVPPFKHEADDICRQFLREHGKGALDNHVYYAVRQGLPGYDGEMPDCETGGIGIVTSSNVCASHCFMRGLASRYGMDVAHVFRHDFESALASLGLVARIKGFSRLNVPEEIPESGIHEYSFDAVKSGKKVVDAPAAAAAASSKLADVLSGTKKIIVAPPRVTAEQASAEKPPPMIISFGRGSSGFNTGAGSSLSVMSKSSAPKAVKAVTSVTATKASKPAAADVGDKDKGGKKVGGDKDTKKDAAAAQDAQADEVDEPGSEECQVTTMEPPKKKPKEDLVVDCSHDRWRELINGGGIAKITIPEIKKFLAENKQPVSGKKEALVERVKKVLGIPL